MDNKGDTKRFLNLPGLDYLFYQKIEPQAACAKEKLLHFFTNVTPNEHLYVSRNGGKIRYTISSNTLWYIYKNNLNWLTIDKTSGQGSDIVNVTIPANTSGSQRTATVTVQSPDVPDVVLKITQYK